MHMNIAPNSSNSIKDLFPSNKFFKFLKKKVYWFAIFFRKQLKHIRSISLKTRLCLLQTGHFLTSTDVFEPIEYILLYLRS